MEDSFINTYLSHRNSSPLFLPFNHPVLICDEVAPEWTSSLLKTDEGGAAESQEREGIKDNNEGGKDPEMMRTCGDNGGGLVRKAESAPAVGSQHNWSLQQFRS